MSTLLPPRRQLPPPPPPRAAHTQTAHTDDFNTRPLGLVARIAKLQLDQTRPLRALPNTSHQSSNPGPILPKASPDSFALVLAGLDPEYLFKLLARPVPPVSKGKHENYDTDRRPVPPRLPSRHSEQPSTPHLDYDLTPDEDFHGVTGSDTYHESYTQEDAEEDQTTAPDPPLNSPFQSGTCVKCHDFSTVDAHASQFPRQYVRSLEDLAYDLTNPFAYETEKARAIFTWMHHNISYDAQSFFAGTVRPATPQSTLTSGLAVCDGYAGLYVELTKKAGLQAYKVSGHGKGFGYQALAPGEGVPKVSTNHAWNCVLMDGEWRLIDATWGAGYLNGSGLYEQQFDPTWFTSTPAEFARRHFPTDPTYQLIADEDGGPVDWEDYILSPEGPTVCNDFNRLDFFVGFLQPTSAVIERGQPTTFTLFKRCEHMSNHDGDNYIYVLFAPGFQEPIPLEQNVEGGWSLVHRIYNENEVSLMFVSTIDGRDAKGVGMRGFKAAVGRKAMTFGGLARWKVE